MKNLEKSEVHSHNKVR